MSFKFGTFFKKLVKNSTSIKQEPLNKISLILLIIVDIFVLTNVFWGLGSVTETIATPYATHSCYQSWKSYRDSTQNETDKNFNLVSNLISQSQYNDYTYQYNQISNTKNGILVGQPNPICEQYTQKTENITKDINLKSILSKITDIQYQINNNNSQINTLENQYNSTLLEKGVNQPQEFSINLSDASGTKTQIDDLKTQNSEFDQQITTLKTDALAQTSSKDYISLLKDASKFNEVNKSYSDYSFWYAVWTFLAQILFLLPLILLVYLLYSLSISKSWGVAALLSWNLLLIFSIPAVIKVFEFLQFGVLLKFVIDIVVALVGNLAFLGSYILIVLIPLIGFLMIMFFQKVVFRPKDKIKQRLQAEQCYNCAFKLNKTSYFALVVGLIIRKRVVCRIKVESF